jgi:hypothetical protein
MPETCTGCETTFRSYAPLIMSVVYSAGEVLVYAQNAGKNIVILKRVLLCIEYSSGGRTTLFIRNFTVGGDTVEQGSTQLKYRVTVSNVARIQAEAEYFEASGRNVSCTFTV